MPINCTLKVWFHNAKMASSKISHNKGDQKGDEHKEDDYNKNNQDQDHNKDNPN